MSEIRVSQNDLSLGRPLKTDCGNLQACYGQESVVTQTYGTVFRIESVSKSGSVTALPLVPSPDPNRFFALFIEDDVDFQIHVDNSACPDRDVGLGLEVHDKLAKFMVRKGKQWSIQALESKGRKFHFIRQSTVEGQVCVGMYAAKHGLTFGTASEAISQIGFKVSYSTPRFLIHVRVTTSPRVLDVLVSESDKVWELKDRLEGLEGFPEFEYGFRLRVGRKRNSTSCNNLEENLTLGDYDMREGETVFVIPIMIGGGYGPPPAEQVARMKVKPVRPAVGDGAEVGERGAVVFGEKSKQNFSTAAFYKDESVEAEDFIIELRMASRFGLA